MIRYEIPLHGFEKRGEKTGPHIIIEGRTVSIVDYSGEEPHDLISLRRHHALRLVRVLTTWLAGEAKVSGVIDAEYGEFKGEPHNPK